MLASIWHELDIDDTLSHCLYVELLLVLGNIVYEYTGDARLDELLIREEVLASDAR